MLKALLAYLQLRALKPVAFALGRVTRTLLAADVGLPVSLALLQSEKAHARAEEYFADAQWEAAVGFMATQVTVSGRRTVDVLNTLQDATALPRVHRHAFAHRVARELVAQPLITGRWTAERFGRDSASVSRAISTMRDHGLVSEVSGHPRRHQVWAARPVLDIYGRALRVFG